MSNEKIPDKTTYTLQDLVEAVRNMGHHEGEVKGWDDKANAARKSLESHTKDGTTARIEYDRAAAVVRKIASNLEKA